MSHTSQNEIDRFDLLSESYQRHHDKALSLVGGNSNFFYDAKIKLIRERLKTTPRNILDFGCGTGRLTERLQANFTSASIVGTDPSTKSIHVAKKQNLSRVAFQTELPEDRFDLIVAAGVFHHIPNSSWQYTLKQLYNRLSVSGQCFIFEHNPISVATRLLLAIAGNDKDATLLYPGHLKKSLQSAGFRESNVDFISFFPSPFTWLHPLEKWLTSIPFGAQYVAWASRQSE